MKTGQKTSKNVEKLFLYVKSTHNPYKIIGSRLGWLTRQKRPTGSYFFFNFLMASKYMLSAHCGGQADAKTNIFFFFLGIQPTCPPVTLYDLWECFREKKTLLSIFGKFRKFFMGFSVVLWSEMSKYMKSMKCIVNH